MTQDVQDYVLDYRQGNILYEIHLIDSPGFDEGTHVDAEVLSRITTYVNNTYKLKQTLAGVIYLHDISVGKLGSVGQRNLRMLEKMIGIDEWDNRTLVTTKWGCTNKPQGEEMRERILRDEEKYFGAMLRHSRQASMVRFDPKSKGKALEIIKPHLNKSFAPEISIQMVDPHGPRLALGETDAGRVVAENLERLHRATGQLEELQASQKILAQKFDEKLFEEFKSKRDKLILKHQLQRAGRWIVRARIVGGTIIATVFTMGPGASIIALEAPFEKFARNQKREERQVRDRLEKEYKEESNLEDLEDLMMSVDMRADLVIAFLWEPILFRRYFSCSKRGVLVNGEDVTLSNSICIVNKHYILSCIRLLQIELTHRIKQSKRLMGTLMVA